MVVMYDGYNPAEGELTSAKWVGSRYAIDLTTEKIKYGYGEDSWLEITVVMTIWNPLLPYN